MALDPGRQQRRQVMVGHVLRNTHSLTLDSGQTVSGMRSRARRCTSAGSSTQRTPWSMRSTFSTSSALRMYAGGPSSPACATRCSPASLACANTRANFSGGWPRSLLSRPTPMKWWRHGSASFERRQRLVLAQVAQEAQDQLGAHAELGMGAVAGVVQPLDHRLEGHAACGVRLRVEEDLGVDARCRPRRARGRPRPCRRSPAPSAARWRRRSRCRESSAGR